MSKRKLGRVALGVALGGAAAWPSTADIVLSQNFDSGSLNVGGSSVNYTNALQPAVTLTPRHTFDNQWWWVHFQATGVTGLTPQFTLPTANAFQAVTAAHRYVYSYDGQNWSSFNNGSVSGGLYRFSNSAAFTQDSVFVAAAIPYPVAKTNAYTAALAANPLVQPTASANGSFVIGSTLGTAGGGYTDSSGRTVEAQDLYAYRITDTTATGPKKKVVLLGGNHSGESTGSWTLQGMTDFLLSSDPVAVQLRQKAEIFVYPQSDPEGRAAGYYRSGPENPTRNHNRYWDQPVDPNGAYTFTDVNAIRSAMLSDTGGKADVFIDFHSYGVASGLGYYTHTNDLAANAFIGRLRAYEPTAQDLTVENPDGIAASKWAPSGLGSRISLTSEVGFLANQPSSRYLTLGANYGRSLFDVIQSGALDGPVARNSQAFRATAQALGPVMHLRLDEAAGNNVAADSSGNNRNGTYTGTVSRGVADPFDADADATAVRFSGNSAPGRVEVPDFTYDNAQDHFTLAFWFNTADIAGGNSQYVFSHGTVSTPQSLNVYLVESGVAGQGNRLRTNLIDADDPTGSSFVDVSPAYADGLWHLYTLVVDEDGARVYVDGALAATGPAGGDAFNPTGSLFFGGRNDGDGNRFYGRTAATSGLLDEVLLFDRALTAADVQSLYAVPEPSAAALVAGAAAALLGRRRRRA